MLVLPGERGPAESTSGHPAFVHTLSSLVAPGASAGGRGPGAAALADEAARDHASASGPPIEGAVNMVIDGMSDRTASNP